MTSSVDSVPWHLTQIFSVFLSVTPVVRTQLWGTVETQEELDIQWWMRREMGPRAI